MRIDDHLDGVHEQLRAAAALGDERTQQIASGLGVAINPAVRLAVMSALAAAVDEITAALLDVAGAPAISLHLDGAELRVDVRLTETPTVAMSATEDGEASARISLRLSEALKAEVEAAARREGASVNTWLVRAASGALAAAGDSRGRRAVGWEGLPSVAAGHRITGWINS